MSESPEFTSDGEAEFGFYSGICITDADREWIVRGFGEDTMEGVEFESILGFWIVFDRTDGIVDVEEFDSGYGWNVALQECRATLDEFRASIHEDTDPEKKVTDHPTYPRGKFIKADA